MDRFIAMTSFRRIVEANSFSAAARQLGLSAAAVTKHVQWLEEDLGVPLLHRTTRSVAPSEAGAAYYRRCVQVLDDIEEAEATVRGDHAAPRGRLRVNAPVSLGITYLGPVMARFHVLHPHVRVDLSLDDAHINPTVEGVDVVLRIARTLADTELVARRIGSLTRVVCASPAYLGQRRPVRRPADLLEHACVIYTRVAQPDLWQFEGPRGPIDVRVTPVAAADNSLVLRDAILEGIGVGVLPSYVAADAIAAGRLCPLLTRYTPSTFDIFALSASTRQRSARVGAFVNLLADEIPRRLAPLAAARSSPGRRDRSRA
ncbi:MAG TPA: LysR family transcriptional regulator [Kofleriaceae bacterium]|nr:LysR family transcriptional regulator [Kofleriaceae bacterium]